jgi:hypothetical protein
VEETGENVALVAAILFLIPLSKLQPPASEARLVTANKLEFVVGRELLHNLTWRRH